MAIIKNSALNPGTVTPIGTWDGDSANYIYGTAGDDIIYGTAGADQIYGGNGRDRLSGGDGDDLLEGGARGDVLDGGAGNDSISYAGSSAGVTISSLFRGMGGDAEGDVIVNVENVFGSTFADSISGNDSANLLYGLGGNDLLFGGGGNDKLYGGFGNDTLEGGIGADQLFGDDGFDIVSYANSAAGVIVDLRSGQVFGGDAQGDTFSAIEGVTGSDKADTLIGNAQDNQLRGGTGDDVLSGDYGSDWLDGGRSSDTLTGDVAGTFFNDTFVLNANVGFGFDKVADFQSGYDKLAFMDMTRTEAFGTDGKLAIGRVDTMHGDHKIKNLQTNDSFVYDSVAKTLYFVDPEFINGNLSQLNYRAIATIENLGERIALSESDFAFI